MRPVVREGDQSKSQGLAAGRRRRSSRARTRRQDASAKDWRKVKLTPGKVFVVGDPKQSIYAFRRADIEAYLEVVEKIIKAQNGVECRLTTNFRSHGKILEVVNGIFSSLIQAR